MSILSALYEHRRKYVGPLAPHVEEAIAILEKAHPAIRTRLAAALITRQRTAWPFSLAGKLTDEENDYFAGRKPMCPAYPKASSYFQANIALGATPAELLPKLTAKEAHEAITMGCTNPIDYVMKKGSGYSYSVRKDGAVNVFETITQPRSLAVARWIAACWRDPLRKEALIRERCERGPHGNEIRGAFIKRIDELLESDIVNGNKTSVTLVFETAMERGLRIRAERAKTNHTPLREPPKWWKPTKYARILLTPAELEQEGREMDHCVGTYTELVADGTSVIIALRVPSNTGLIDRSTAELSGDCMEILQHRGPLNDNPTPLCEKALHAYWFRIWKPRAPNPDKDVTAVT